ncbi:ABC transporter ATP-binding protein [Nakamurella flavida]|uniref:ABC transporter ATP-binding protein n=1 Tax=Nakamurella flavida TaxID=363630 RepID=A0A938YKU7_9ACTN|nr:ATP-binding cassette domain-containing protein [Nakamurella flavida]MBM9476396.1 ABC transporter ATP-binding protein [Nakamurella flavida]MDP9779503.1 ABC-type glutathione transport system ATPase component [Nakamurella flavida]
MTPELPVDHPLLEVRHLVKTFPAARGRGRTPVRAVDDVSFTVRAGGCLAVVGESGSGKSTLARTVLRLIEPDAGEVLFRGEDLVGLSRSQLAPRRRHFQMIFQDPYASLHPRQTVRQLICEPWSVHRDVVPRAAQPARVAELLDQVGLPASYADLYPQRLSGGQRQRVAIARALALEPDILILDEPVSALDVSIQAQVITLLMKLQERLDLAYVFISHDLALVRLIADRVAVMYHGSFVEVGPTDQVYADPQDDYTRTLLAASPGLGDPVPGR